MSGKEVIHVGARSLALEARQASFEVSDFETCCMKAGRELADAV